MIQEKLAQEFIAAHSAEWIEADIDHLRQQFSLLRSQETANLAGAIARVCREAGQQQDTGNKGPAAYLCISFLRTNIMIDVWDYRLDLYDENFYLDPVECSGSWQPEFIWRAFQQRLEAVRTAAQTGIYRNKIRASQLADLKLTMADQYHLATLDFTRGMITEALLTPEYSDLNKTRDFKIIMGEYQSNLVVIHQQYKENTKEGLTL